MSDKWWKDGMSYWSIGCGNRKRVKNCCKVLRAAGLRYKVMGREIKMPVQEKEKAENILKTLNDPMLQILLAVDDND